MPPAPLAELVVRHRGRRGQFPFALEAKDVLPAGEAFLAAKSHRGLHLIARDEDALAAPLDAVRRAFGGERLEIDRTQRGEPVVQVSAGIEIRYLEEVADAIRARRGNASWEYVGVHHCVLRFDLRARRLFGLPAAIARLTEGKATLQLIVTAYA
jgi:hypothetical protein